MDQDAFRSLLVGSRSKQLAPTATKSAQKVAPSGPAFKPRKVKKSEGKYRDRAAERRDGVGNDYAQVEAVLEDFQKRAAHEDKDVIEEQRKYLGGDSEHTILVKGLDMSLLEQKRARAAASTEDDEILEQVFAETTSAPTTEPKKRTREDIIRELKAKRQNGDQLPDSSPVPNPVEEEGSAFESARAAGKFRPIGFKPIGQTEERLKKRKAKERKEGVKKKKQRVESTAVQSGTEDGLGEKMPKVSQDCDKTGASETRRKPPEPEPTPLDENFEIFAGAGDYDGFPGDEESDEEPHDVKRTGETEVAISPVPAAAAAAKGWFDEPEPEPVARSATPPPEKSPQIPETVDRLKPLESSALPSIRDFLAMDEAVEKAEKRKARKDKKRKKKEAGGDDDD